MSLVYALLQMLAMLVLLVAGKKHGGRERHRNCWMPMPALGYCGLDVPGGCDRIQLAYMAHQE